MVVVNDAGQLLAEEKRRAMENAQAEPESWTDDTADPDDDAWRPLP